MSRELTAALQAIPLAQIIESPHNPRQHFDADKLNDLAASLRQVGQLTPVIVRPVGTQYELAAGHRRFRAAQLAGLESMLAVVRPMDDTAFLEVLTIENLQRDDVHPLEEADGYHALLLQGGIDVHALADRLGKSVAYVRDRLALRALIADMRRLFFEGAFSVAHAIVIARCSADAQELMLDSRGIFDMEYIRSENGFLLKPEGEAEEAESDDEKDAPEPDRVADILANRKVMTVRALKAWVREHIRMTPDAPEFAISYPDAAIAVALAPQVVEITTNWGQFKEGTPRPRGTWKPVHVGSCEHIVLGVHAIGPNQGRTQPICIASTECRTHWAEEMEDAERIAARVNRPDDDGEDGDDEEYSWQREQREREEARAQLKPLLPYIGDLAAEALRTAPMDATSEFVQQFVIADLNEEPDADSPFPLKGDATEVLRAVAWQRIANMLYDGAWNMQSNVEQIAEALGMSREDLVKAAEKAKKTNPKPEPEPEDEDVDADDYAEDDE
jgi:ParB/RepB/Spo0J family partition protein